MELSFAIETIKTEKEMNLYGNGYFICDTKAIDTVLEALDNNVSKEYHEMVIKEQNDIINDLKNRLDNSISKDNIRKLIEEESVARQEAKKEYKPEMQVAHEYTRLTLKSLLKE